MRYLRSLLLFPTAGLAASLGMAGCSKPKLPSPTAPKFELVKPSVRNFNDQADYQSTLESISNVSLAAEIDGRIVSMPMREGEQVKPGQLLFSLDQVQQRAQTNAAVAEARKDRVNAERYIFLNDQGAISTKDRDYYVTQAIQSADKAKADRATLGYKNVLAPIAGEVGNINYKLGSVVRQGETIVNIVDNSRLWVRMDVPGDLAWRVKPGLPVQLSSPGTTQQLAEGQITFIAPSLDKQSQTLLVKATFGNPNGTLRNNQRVNATLRFSSNSMLSIPESSVLLQAGQSFVFLAVSQAQAERALGRSISPPPPAGSLVALQTQVSLGTLQQGMFPVISGISEGDRLVLGNLAALRSGMAVNNK
jgi:RND family efflux transporter MFP subunit